MIENQEFFQENVRNSFKKVKEDADSINLKIEALKQDFLKNKEDFNVLKEKILEILEKIENKVQNKPLLISPQETKGSFDRHSTDTRQTLDNLSTHPTEIFSEISDLNTKKDQIISNFYNLTNKEFIIFMAVYQIEEETKTPVNYSQIAQKLKISQSSVRDHVSELFLKRAPLEKLVNPNRKVSLSIKKGFRDLNLITEILTFRQTLDRQTTLV